jgi:hypothetical protein
MGGGAFVFERGEEKPIGGHSSNHNETKISD